MAEIEEKRPMFFSEDKDRKLYSLNEHLQHIKEEFPKSWMIRKCSAYQDEYKACNGMGGRFHQLYVDGKYTDCKTMKDNFSDCKLVTAAQDVEAAKRIIQREEVRIALRLKDHFANDVWETRTTPPADWNKPLPDLLAKASEESLLKKYQDNGGLLTTDDKLNSVSSKLATSLPTCSIL